MGTCCNCVTSDCDILVDDEMLVNDSKVLRELACNSFVLYMC